MAAWVKRAVAGAGVLVAGAALGVGVLVGPLVLDDLALDRVVQAVALEWRDFGRERAWERLQYELDHKAVGMQVADEDCALKSRGENKVVECAWSAEVRLPGTRWAPTLSFTSRAVVMPDGDLR